MPVHSINTGAWRANVSHQPRNSILPVLAAAALAPLTMPAAQATETSYLEGNVTLATDYMTRGVSQTLSSPALQAGVEFAHENGFSAYLWGSNVDFVADGDPDDGSRLELNLALGYGVALSERLAVSLRRVQYLFPGTNPGLHYDYGEWLGELALDDRHRLTLAYSADIFGSGRQGTYVAASTGIDLPAGLSLDVEVGRSDLRAAYGASYHHGQLSVSGSLDPFTWQLAYHVTDRGARNIYYASVIEPRVVLSVDVAVW
jgi:uncharacterized protein (TIGR02001 family)